MCPEQGAQEPGEGDCGCVSRTLGRSHSGLLLGALPERWPRTLVSARTSQQKLLDQHPERESREELVPVTPEIPEQDCGNKQERRFDSLDSEYA